MNEMNLLGIITTVTGCDRGYMQERVGGGAGSGTANRVGTGGIVLGI